MVVNEKKELFETMPVKKAIATMALPTIVSQLINLVYNVVDTFFIGQTGNTYMIAAISLAYTLYIMTVSFSNLFGIGGGSLMARLSGKGKDEEAKNVCAYSFYGALIIALLYALFIFALCNPLLNLLGADLNTINYAREYVYTVVVIGSVPIVLSATLAHLIRNAGYAKQASLGLSLGGILNIILDPILMFLVFPKGKEVFAAALATLLSNIVSFIFLFYMFKKVANTSSLSLKTSNLKAIKKEQVKELYAVGIPSAILTGLFDIANMFLNAKMAVYGAEAVAALGIVIKVERLPNAINIGICQGMLPIVAYNYSAKNIKRMNDVTKTATIAGFVVCLISMTFFEIFAKTITSIFINTNTIDAALSTTTLALASFFLRVRCLASPFQFMNYRSSFMMQAMGDGKDTLIHAFVRELVFYIPFMYILDILFKLNGLICSLIAGEFCGMIFALILLNRWFKKLSN